MLDSGHAIKVDACRDGFGVIEELDEDFVKALQFFYGIFSFRFEILFAVVWSLLFLLFFLQCKFAMTTSICN